MLVAEHGVAPPLKVWGVNSEELDYDLDWKNGGIDIYWFSPYSIDLEFQTPTWLDCLLWWSPDWSWVNAEKWWEERRGRSGFAVPAELFVGSAYIPASETYWVVLEGFMIVWSFNVPLTTVFLLSLEAASIPGPSLCCEISVRVPLTLDSLCDSDLGSFVEVSGILMNLLPCRIYTGLFWWMELGFVWHLFIVLLIGLLTSDNAILVPLLFNNLLFGGYACYESFSCLTSFIIFFLIDWS